MVADRIARKARRILRADLWATVAPILLIVGVAFGITMLSSSPPRPSA